MKIVRPLESIVETQPQLQRLILISFESKFAITSI
jgi:hypothetical protein